MSEMVERLGSIVPKRLRIRSKTKSFGHRLSGPNNFDSLEQRCVPSALIAPVAVEASSPRHSTVDLRDAALASSLKELHNIAFPTPDGQSELLDVYTPIGSAPSGGWPVIIAIHGGGWRRFSKAGYGSRVAGAFVPHGFVVVAPNYVLSAPGSPSWPENLDDVEAAVSWVRTNSQTLDVNSNEIAAMGESAGANLAALLGTYSPQNSQAGDSSAVDAVIASSTPADLTSLYRESPLAGLAAEQMLGGWPDQISASYIAASPVDQVSPGDPPMLLIHGRQDPLIPPGQSRELQSALTAAGVRNQLIFVNGGHNLDFPPHYPNLVPQVLSFLDNAWNKSNLTAS